MVVLPPDSSNGFIPPVIIQDSRARSKGAARAAVGVGLCLADGRGESLDEGVLFRSLCVSAYRAGLGGDERAEWVGRWRLIRGYLVECNLRLVAFTIKQYDFRGDWDELQSVGEFTLLRAVDYFDPWRGFRFSTYATRSILRELSKVGIAGRKRFLRDQSYVAASLVPQVASRPDRRLGDLRVVLRENLGGLNDRQLLVLTRRFLMGGGRQSLLRQIGKDMGVTHERVRQIQIVALEKLRRAMDRGPTEKLASLRRFS